METRFSKARVAFKLPENDTTPHPTDYIGCNCEVGYFDTETRNNNTGQGVIENVYPAGAEVLISVKLRPYNKTIHVRLQDIQIVYC